MKNSEEYLKLKETKLSRTEIYDGKILHVVRDDVGLPNGSNSKREFVLHKGAVCIVPLTSENEIIMEKQFRYPFDDVIWEIPAGKLDSIDEDPLSAAKRELKEETGYTSDNFRYIGTYYGSPAILSEKIHMYLATDIKSGTQNLDDDEFLDVVKMPFEKAVELILKNEVPDGKTQAAVLKVKYLLGL